jgi:hypothetical protein
MRQHPGVVFKDVAGFPGYRIGNDGSLWSCRRNGGHGHVRILDTWRRIGRIHDSDGYTRAFLCDGTASRVRLIHRLVLETFVGPCPAGMVACHNNGVRDDNRVENVRWDTPEENVRDKIAHGTHQAGEKHPRATLTEGQFAQFCAECGIRCDATLADLPVTQGAFYDEL